jgi:hypothetical protein
LVSNDVAADGDRDGLSLCFSVYAANKYYVVLLDADDVEFGLVLFPLTSSSLLSRTAGGAIIGTSEDSTILCSTSFF